jgi:hypothetical protein
MMSGRARDAFRPPTMLQSARRRQARWVFAVVIGVAMAVGLGFLLPT